MSSDLDGDRLGRMSHLAEISQRFSNTWMKLHFFLNLSLNIGSCRAYILREAKPWLLLATDTFVARDGEFLFQTFAANAGSK